MEWKDVRKMVFTAWLSLSRGKITLSLPRPIRFQVLKENPFTLDQEAKKILNMMNFEGS